MSRLAVEFEASTDEFKRRVAEVRALVAAAMSDVGSRVDLAGKSLGSFTSTVALSNAATLRSSTAIASMTSGVDRYAGQIRNATSEVERFRRTQEALAAGGIAAAKFGSTFPGIERVPRYSESPLIQNLMESYHSQRQMPDGTVQFTGLRTTVDALSAGLGKLQDAFVGVGAGAEHAGRAVADMGGAGSGMQALVGDAADARIVFGGLSSTARLAGAGVLVLGSALLAAIPAYAKAREETQHLEFALKASGTASGMTVDKIDALAASLNSTAGATRSEVFAAASALTRFDAVSGTAFERTIRLAKDMAATLGTSVASEAERLGRALQDPAKAADDLSSAGIRFTTAERQMISSLAEAGNVAQAQTAILAALEEKVGGNGAAASGGVAGAFSAAAMSTGEFAKELLDLSGISPAVVQGLQAIGATADYLRGAMGGFRSVTYGEQRASLDDQLKAARKEVDDLEASAKSVGYRPDATIAAAQARVDGLVNASQALDGAFRVEAAAHYRATEAAKAAAADRSWRDMKKVVDEVGTSLEGVATKSEKVAKIRENSTKLRDKLEAGLTQATTPEQRKQIEDAMRQVSEVERRKIAAVNASGGGLDGFQSALVASKKRTEVLLQEGRLLGDTGHELDYYRAKLELEAAAKRSNITITGKMATEIEGAARAYQAASLEVDRYKQAIRTADEARYDVKIFANSFAQDMLHGKSAVEALGNAVTRLRDKLAERLVDSLLDSILGKSGTPNSGLSGLWGDLFGGGAQQSTGLGGGLFSWIASLFHTGGVVGGAAATRAVSPSTFNGAPRFHSGLLPGELPAILMKGETVLNTGLTNRLATTMSGLSSLATSNTHGGTYAPTIHANIRGSSGDVTSDRQYMDMVKRELGPLMDAHASKWFLDQSRPGGLVHQSAGTGGGLTA